MTGIFGKSDVHVICLRLRYGSYAYEGVLSAIDLVENRRCRRKNRKSGIFRFCRHSVAPFSGSLRLAYVVFA